MRKPKPYRVGDWFAVPLEGGKYALGLIARAAKTGTLLGYFFGPATEDLPAVDRIGRLSARDAILIRKFGDMGLDDGEWTILEHSDNWNPQNWPMPMFGHIDIVDPNIAFGRRYDEVKLNQMVSEIRIDVQEAKKLFEDGLSGHMALVGRLSRLLGNRKAD